MGFWTGIAKGMAANRAQGNVEAERDERSDARDAAAKREAFLDKRYNTERSDRLATEKASRAERATAAGVQASQWQAGMDVAAENTEATRAATASKTAYERAQDKRDAEAEAAALALEAERTAIEDDRYNADLALSASKYDVAQARLNIKQEADEDQTVYDRRVQDEALRIAERNRIEDQLREDRVIALGQSKIQYDREIAAEALVIESQQYNKEQGRLDWRQEFEESQADYNKRMVADALLTNQERYEKAEERKDWAQGAQENDTEYARRMAEQALAIDESRYLTDQQRKDLAQKKDEDDTAYARRIGELTMMVDAMQFDIGIERDDAAIARADEEKATAQTIKLLTLSKELSSPFGGGRGDPNNADAPDSADMTEATLLLSTELGGQEVIDSMKPKDKEFFTTLMDNPEAAHGVMAFVQSQREKGNTINLTDLPKHINLAVGKKAQGETAYKEWVSNFDAEGVTDNKSYLAGMKALMGYTPAQVAWNIRTGVPDSTSQQADYDMWVETTIIKARRMMDKLQADKSNPALLRSLSTAIQETEATGSDNAGVRSRGLAALWPLTGKATASDARYQGNPLINAYGGGDGPVDVAAVTGEPTMTPEAGGTSTDFKTRAEAQKWMTANPEEAAAAQSITINGVAVPRKPQEPVAPQPEPVSPQAEAPVDADFEANSEAFLQLLQTPDVSEEDRQKAFEEFAKAYGMEATRGVIDKMLIAQSEAQ